MATSAELSAYAKLLGLTRIEGYAAPEAELVAREIPDRKPRASFWKTIDAGTLVIVAVVVLVTAAVVSYFTVIAAPRFESEARFVVRTPGKTLVNNPFSELLQSSGIGRSGDDSYIIREYLISRDAVAYVERNELLRKAFANRDADFIWKFPNFYTRDNEEGLYKHYQRMVTTSYDSTTGVSILRVQAFNPTDARKIAAALLDAAEELVNRLNSRAKHDSIAAAEGEVERHKTRVVSAQNALTTFRNREAFLDPSQASIAALEAISGLSSELVQVRLQISENEQMSPQGPQTNALRIRVKALEDEILSQRRRLAGDARSIATVIAEYERLALEREFAERSLLAAMSAVELARLEAERQQVYIERIASPSLPDHPFYPYRALWSIISVVAGLAVVKLATIFLADVRHHADE
jgi:capsular polysaccharide transport system permease protein